MAFSNGTGTGSLHIAQALTDLAVAYKPSADGYLRDKFFQRKDVAHLTDKLRQIDKANMLLLHDLKVSNDGQVPAFQYRITTDITYNCQGYGAETVVGDMDVGNADVALEHETRQMEHALGIMTTALEHEAVNNQLRSTGVLTNNTTVSAANRWDNYGSSTSDPIGDMLSACTLVRYRTGKNVNRLAMSETLWNVIAQHPNVLTRVQLNGGMGSLLTVPILAGILRIDPSSILISAASYNSAAQGATAAYKSFMGSDCVIAYVADGGLNDYSLGHEFAFSGYGSAPVVVVKYRDEKRGGLLGSNIIRVGSIVDFKVTVPDAAYLFKTCLDTSNTIYGAFVD